MLQIINEGLFQISGLKDFGLYFIFYQFKLQVMHPVVKTIWDIGIAVGPVIGYVYQYFLIRKRKSIGTFSIKLCGALLFCNILRLGFYFFTYYDKALMIQSLLMIAAQILLLQICVKTMNEEGKFDFMYGENLEEGVCSRFWNWKQLYKYLLLTAVFAFVVIILSVELSRRGYTEIGEFIGFVSLFSESLIMVPQVVENYKQRRVKGLSHLLVFLNNIGDLMKLAYFFLNNQPKQFIICGFIQVTLDITVIVQIFYYGWLNKEKSEGSESEQNDNAQNEKKVQPATDQKMEVPAVEQQNKPPPADYKQLDQDLHS